MPRATHLFEDIDMAFGLVEALYVGVQALSTGDLAAEDKAEWEQAKKCLERRK